jgi:hypothetical protein
MQALMGNGPVTDMDYIEFKLVRETGLSPQVLHALPSGLVEKWIGYISAENEAEVTQARKAQ